MLIVISPAKTLDYHTPLTTDQYSQPDYLPHAQQLIERARQYNTEQLMDVMAISEKIARLNIERFQQWQQPFTPANARPAALAFQGDVYGGLDAASFSEKDVEFAQQHLRILSGLYGLLRPLDLMQAYRLEMGRKIDNPRGKNLYQFWGDIITDGLNQQLQAIHANTLINLASNEYFKAVNPKQLNAEIITPEFKDYKNGQYKMMGVYAKRARGLLSRFIIQHRIQEVAHIKQFNEQGYRFNPELSQGNHWVFSRKQ